MARTPLGEETLQLADEGILDASAGFLPMPGGMQWRNQDEVRLTKVWLGHIAMTPDPAYEGARVLAVRSAAPTSATPGLDQLRAWLLQDRYAGL
jgi:phage head maturation protease